MTVAAAAAGSAMAFSAAIEARADAIVDLSGSDSNAGVIDLTAAGAAFGGTVTSGGVTGYSLWGLLGGTTAASTSTSASGTTTTNGGIVNFTPTGDNSKNAILRDYVVVTDASGNHSIVSLGEIDPNFSGTTASNSDLISFTGSTASLSFLAPGASGRDLTNITSIALVAAPALPGLPSGVTTAPPSTAVSLTGSVANPGSYGLTQLQALPATTETVNGDSYTGPPLWDFIDAIDGDVLDQFVVTAGTDGYEVVLSLAELDPNLGSNPGDDDLLPYADTKGNFPGDGVARTILPGDTAFAHGRWESDVDLVNVTTVPEPGSLALLLSGLAGLPFARRIRRRAAQRSGNGMT